MVLLNENGDNMLTIYTLHKEKEFFKNEIEKVLSTEEINFSIDNKEYNFILSKIKNGIWEYKPHDDIIIKLSYDEVKNKWEASLFKQYPTKSSPTWIHHKTSNSPKKAFQLLKEYFSF